MVAMYAVLVTERDSIRGKPPSHAMQTHMVQPGAKKCIRKTICDAITVSPTSGRQLIGSYRSNQSFRPLRFGLQQKR